MGGNAISESRRLCAGDYRKLRREVLGELFNVLPGVRVEAVPAYRLKMDFGDLDLLVESDHLPTGWQERVARALDSKEVVANEPRRRSKYEPTYSFEHRGFQVDLILSQARYFDFAMGYLSWNDLGNLLGNIVRPHGLKLGQRGLLYPLLSGSRLIAELEVTRDFHTALELLDLDPARWDDGFRTLPDIFSFVAGSAFFDPAAFALANRNHEGRKRDCLRPTYRGFLGWIGEREARKGAKANVSLVETAKAHIPGFALNIEKTLAADAKATRLKQRFNGHLVSEWTGLEGRELGKFMRDFKDLCLKTGSDPARMADRLSQEEFKGAVLLFMKARAHIAAQANPVEAPA